MKNLFSILALSLVALTATWSQIPTGGLVAYYPFNNNVNDQSGNGNNGTTNGGVNWTSDRFGNTSHAAGFDGSTGYISVPNSNSLNPQQISVCVWVNYEGGSGNPRIYSKWQPVVGDAYQLFRQFGTAVVGFDNTTFRLLLERDFSPNSWDFYVVERDIDSVRVYVNGNKITTQYYAGSLVGNSAPLVFGVNGGTIGTGQDYLQGKLDDIRIYGRPLSEAEIQDLYHENGWPLLTSGLVAYYPFNNNANDSSGNGNDGTTNGGITWVSDRNGNPNAAASFNGLDASISVSTSSTFQIHNDITVAAWVKCVSPQSNSYVVDKYYGGSIPNHGWLLGTYGTEYPSYEGQALFEGRDGFTTSNTIKSGPSGGFADGQWHFLVGLRNGSNWMIYKDGVLANQYDPGTFGSIDDGGNICIGATNLDDHFWNGQIDDIRIYNRALSGAEIESLFHEGGFQNCEKPVLSGTPPTDGGTYQCLVDIPATATVTASDCNGAVTVTYNEAETNPGSRCNNTITRTWTATNQYGTSIFSQIIHVNDTLVPLITCPHNITVTLPPGGCAKKVTFEALATDGCNATPSVTYDHARGSDFGTGTTTVTVKATDACGNTDSCKFTVTVVDNEPPTITCPGDITVEGNIFGQCGATVNPGTPSASDNCSFSVAGVRSDAKPLSDPYPLGTTTITWTATDASTNQDSCTQKITVTNPAPVVSITSPPSGALYAIGSTVNFTGSYTDNAGGTHTAIWMADANSFAGTVNEGAQTVSASYTFTAAGVYLMKLTVDDGCGGSGTTTTVGGLDAIVVIYDPNAGFVTGGGWIESPAGAYRADLSLTGKANFGFVSKYQKGKSIPTGETEFQFKVGNLNFHSSVYEWLVIAGAKAQYKGSGTINNGGNYGFMLTATDGQLGSGGGVDKFRMKIWDNGDAIVYDNQYGGSDNSDPTTAIASGSIIVHKSLAKEAVDPTAEIVPTTFALNRNYPNPFNPTTTIKYSLVTDSKVRLTILDVLGQVVATLADDVEQAGYRAAVWDASSVTSGLYFYRLEATSVADPSQRFTQVKKMLLIK